MSSATEQGPADLLGVRLELGRGGVLECHGQRGDLVVVGTALERREHREVDAVLKVVHRVFSLALHPPLALAALRECSSACQSAMSGNLITSLPASSFL